MKEECVVASNCVKPRRNASICINGAVTGAGQRLKILFKFQNGGNTTLQNGGEVKKQSLMLFVYLQPSDTERVNRIHPSFME